MIQYINAVRTCTYFQNGNTDTCIFVCERDERERKNLNFAVIVIKKCFNIHEG